MDMDIYLHIGQNMHRYINEYMYIYIYIYHQHVFAQASGRSADALARALPSNASISYLDVSYNHIRPQVNLRLQTTPRST